MSAAVGAALKKIALALATDRKALQKVGMAVLVIVVALFMPMVAIVSVFSGTLKLDTAALQVQIQENLTPEQRQMLQHTEDTMNAISSALQEAQMPERVKEAQVLYILALYDHGSQPGFVSRLVSCFQKEQTDEQLIAVVNRTFGTDIQTEHFTQLVGNVRSQYVDTTQYVDFTTKNNLDLVQWAIAAENLNQRQMKDRCPQAEFLGTGVVENYALEFKGSLYNAHATISPKEGESVPVGIWRITKPDEQRLDSYEGYHAQGFRYYDKTQIPVQMNDGTQLSAMVYIMNPRMTFGNPSKGYYDIVREGYEDCGLDTNVLDQAVQTSMDLAKERMEYGGMQLF